MKKTFSFYFLLCLFFIVAVTSCNKTTELPIGDPYSKVEGINGSFKLSKVTQVDERTTALVNTLDISNAFIGDTAMQMSFNSTNKTFSITPGSTPNVFKVTSGTWRFDDDTYPTKLILTSNGVDIDMPLSSTIRVTETKLGVKFTRLLRGKAATSYIFTLDRQ